MLQRWIPRILLTTIFALALGCSGQPANQLSPAAMPIAVKMLDAIDISNNSLMAGQLEQAQLMHNTRVITDKDFKLLLAIHELTGYNNWSDAKKLINEAMAKPSG